jgi:hypothetical protein
MIVMMLNREVRRVPRDYEPPRDERGRPHPCFDAFYEVALREWGVGRERWNSGDDPDREGRSYTWEEWHGDAPDPDYHYPGERWSEDAEMGIRMYETTTEGTPISSWYPDTRAGRRMMARELAAADTGITSDLSEANWLAVIEGQVAARNIGTGELS